MNDTNLAELCRLMEVDSRTLSPDAVWLSGQQPEYLHLRSVGALALAQELALSILCPECCSESIRPEPSVDIADVACPYRAYCMDCGWINLAAVQAHNWQLQPHLLARWLAGGLGLLARYSVEVVIPDVLWRLGEIEHRRKRRTVFFGRRLAVHADAVASRLSQLVAPGAEVIITSSDIEPLLLGALDDRRLVPLRAIAHIRKHGFVIENLDAFLSGSSTVTQTTETSLRLIHTRGVALVGGKEIDLSPQMYTFLKVLEEADGDEVHKRFIAEHLGIEASTFRTADIVKRHKQVYQTFVDKDDKGHYWLRPEFITIEGR
jgi:hypothetical protein